MSSRVHALSSFSDDPEDGAVAGRDGRSTRRYDGRVSSRSADELATSDSLVVARRLQGAGDIDGAVLAALSGWLEVLVDGRAAEMDSFLALLPDPQADDADVLAVRACCARMRGDRAGSRLLMARSRSVRDHGEESPLFSLFVEDDEDLVAEAIEEVVSIIEQGRLRGRSHAYAVYVAGWTLLRSRRDPLRACELLESARADAAARGFTVLAARAAANLAFAFAFMGALTLALSTLNSNDMPEDGPWRLYDGGIQDAALGLIRYWRGELSAARTAFTAVIQGYSDAPYAHFARVFAALVAAEVGGSEARIEALAELQKVPQVTLLGVPWRSWRAIAECALARARGDRSTTIRLARQVLRADNVPVATALAADALRWAGDVDGARAALGRISTSAPPGYLVASVGVTRALVAYRAGDTRTAHFRLEQALDAAADEQSLLPFCRDEEALRRLLRSHVSAGTRHEVMLATILGRTQEETSALSSLSGRERQVLAHLRTTMTPAEIAVALDVSLNTLKTHQRAIYRKLGVSTRRAATRLRE